MSCGRIGRRSVAVASQTTIADFPGGAHLRAGPAPARLAMYLYQGVAALPLVSPHGHVSPAPVRRPAGFHLEPG